MNRLILNTDIQEFINKNLSADISKLLFKGSPFEDVSIQEIAEQIEAKKKAKKKLTTWFKAQQIYYPNKLNIEQTSSEITAKYKSTLLQGNTLIDLTGGFGIDAYYFAKAFKKVMHCEHNERLSAIVKHNLQQLDIKNIETITTDGIDYLAHHKEYVDCIYVDPSRRDDAKGKVFLLKDCEPNLPKHLETLFQFSDNILIKTSPLLDITNGIQELKNVSEIHVVALDNEVKELLFLLKKGFNGVIKIKTINIKKDDIETFESVYQSSVEATFSTPLKYLYESNAAILKAGLFNEVSHQLKIDKLHVNSHLYTSLELIEFPGRHFEIIQKISYNTKEIKKHFPSLKANITTRNFPETVAQIRKKTKLKDGGDQYLFFTTDNNNKHIVLACKKV